MTPPQPTARRLPGLRGGRLIALTVMGSLLALGGGRWLLRSLERPLTPMSPGAELERSRRWSVDPQRRRDAALLLSGREGSPATRRRVWLRGQGWGPGALAAVSLKQAALAAEANGRSAEAEALWRQLLARFPQQAASADALYALGRGAAPLRELLLQRFPAHPAGLAAAQEAGRSLHLARWGPRWPGAEPLLRQHCRQRTPVPSIAERQVLAAALAQLGDGRAAFHCLGGAPAPASLQLSLARALLKGGEEDQQRAVNALLLLVQQNPDGPQVEEALGLLAQQPGAGTLPRLRRLPPPLRDSAPVQARLALEGAVPWGEVLRRWPRDPSSWDLQWELARTALLQRQWKRSEALLAGLPSAVLPAPLAARQLFWLGYGAWIQGNGAAARERWQQVLRISPGGYYGWRARLRLGLPAGADPRQGDAGAVREAKLRAAPAVAAPELAWHPLASGQKDLDALWRLGQPLEAWELWRHRRGGQPAESPADLQTEGRLRTAIGDDWLGLGQLEQAALRLPQSSCRVHWQREQLQHPRRFPAEFSSAAAAAGIDPALLLAVARQESRFTPAVSSPAGAQGLLQLMPATAAELAERPLDPAALKDPRLNAQLGARYLRQLLDRWQGDAFLAIASYNAGHGAVAGWQTSLGADVRREPELWTEAIPYPETRLYTKKVLGNLWTYRQGNPPPC